MMWVIVSSQVAATSLILEHIHHSKWCELLPKLQPNKLSFPSSSNSISIPFQLLNMPCSCFLVFIRFNCHVWCFYSVQLFLFVFLIMWYQELWLCSFFWVYLAFYIQAIYMLAPSILVFIFKYLYFLEFPTFFLGEIRPSHTINRGAWLM